MTRTGSFISIIVSAIVGCVAALTVCLVFFFFIYKPVQSNADQKSKESILEPSDTPTPQIQEQKVNASDVNSIALETGYKDYFEENSKCRKSYNELYGNTDGFFSSGSSCRAKVVFKRDGTAVKSIEMWRYDKTAKEEKVVEKSDWTTTITNEQFAALAELIVNNKAFNSWREGTMINVSNSKIIVNYKNGVKAPMSNVDEKTTDFLPMINAFKQLESKIVWKKV